MADNYRFPIDNQTEYPGYIKFEAKKEDTSTLAESLARQALYFESFPTQLSGSTGPSPEITLDQKKSFFAAATSQQRQAGNESLLAGGESVGTIKLYLPTNIQITDGIEYQNVDLGARGETVAGAIGRGEGIGGIVQAGFEGITGISSITDLMREGLSNQAGQLALMRILGKVGEDFRGAVESQTGITLNPNRRSLLRGVAIRRFRFVFKMIPTSAKESAEITNIIKFFRREMYPEDIPVAGITVGMEFPAKFHISMVYDNHPVATGILPCYLENFDTNYNPSTMGMHRNPDGSYSFPEIDISLGFVEHRALRRKDIEEGGY